MDELTLTTPGLLFSALSLLLLAYTNRFLAIAGLIRRLHDQYLQAHDGIVLGQIKLLRRRLYWIRTMQIMGVASLFFCVLCMFLLFGEKLFWGKAVFEIALVCLLISLAISVYEILLSSRALELQLKDIEDDLATLDGKKTLFEHFNS
jgi:hypothetical protein